MEKQTQLSTATYSANPPMGPNGLAPSPEIEKQTQLSTAAYSANPTMDPDCLAPSIHSLFPIWKLSINTLAVREQSGIHSEQRFKAEYRKNNYCTRTDAAALNHRAGALPHQMYAFEDRARVGRNESRQFVRKSEAPPTATTNPAGKMMLHHRKARQKSHQRLLSNKKNFAPHTKIYRFGTG